MDKVPFLPQAFKNGGIPRESRSWYGDAPAQPEGSWAGDFAYHGKLVVAVLGKGKAQLLHQGLEVPPLALSQAARYGEAAVVCPW